MKLVWLCVLLSLFCVVSSSLNEWETENQKEVGKAPQCVTLNSCRSKDWIRAHRANPEESLRLVAAVRPKDGSLEELHELLMKVSTPKSASYGKHLSLDQLRLLTTDERRVRLIETFLFTNRISFEKTINGDFFVIHLSVGLAERLLQTEFFHYVSQATSRDIIRTERYSLPASLAEAIEFLGDTTSFPVTLAPPLMVKSYGASNTDAGNINPMYINELYSISDNTVSNQMATQSLFESLGQSFSPADLIQFEEAFDIPVHNITDIIGSDNATECAENANDCIEANLDVQYIMAVAQNSPTTFWSVGSAGDIFLNWILAVANMTNPPLVHSMSYGSIEVEEDPGELMRFDVEAQKLGLRGVTIVVSSGDDGVANFLARNDPSQCGFSPSFPATSPSITAVGATQGPEYGGAPEIVCSSGTGGLITSGGGFSTIFSQASYQADAVSSYMQSASLPPPSMYNMSGRGYPDVALVGHNYLVVIGGQFYQVSGTSCSAPTFAGMLTLINNARLNMKKPPLGFVTPALYSMSSDVFNDITVGLNNCCATAAVCCEYGFYAGAGWDPTTGLGSVNFQNLLAAFTSM